MSQTSHPKTGIYSESTGSEQSKRKSTTMGLYCRLYWLVWSLASMPLSLVYSLQTLTSVHKQTRQRFLSSFVVSTAFLWCQADECPAKMPWEKSTMSNNNPRYIERELQMKYADGPDGNPRTRGVLVRRLTGDNTPYEFPVRPVSLVKEWPEKPPFEPEDFFRSDENDDGWFYSVPKLVYHIDEPAVSSLTQFYRKNIPPKSDVLDICSSWVSHYPLEFPETMGKICATGRSLAPPFFWLV